MTIVTCVSMAKAVVYLARRGRHGMHQLLAQPVNLQRRHVAQKLECQMHILLWHRLDHVAQIRGRLLSQQCSGHSELLTQDVWEFNPHKHTV